MRRRHVQQALHNPDQRVAARASELQCRSKRAAGTAAHATVHFSAQRDAQACMRSVGHACAQRRQQRSIWRWLGAKLQEVSCKRDRVAERAAGTRATGLQRALGSRVAAAGACRCTQQGPNARCSKLPHLSTNGSERCTSGSSGSSRRDGRSQLWQHHGPTCRSSVRRWRATRQLRRKRSLQLVPPGSFTIRLSQELQSGAKAALSQREVDGRDVDAV
jgi:hypothetical protein